MTDIDQTPKMFISYSWSSPQHEEWVLKLAEELVSQGIDVKFDKWHLKPGHDANKFMEQMVSDKSVTKVIMICDKKYVEKSNNRKGGAGTEAQIITPEIYENSEQDKYAAVVKELRDDGKPYVPTYYGDRIFFDLSDDNTYAVQFEQLVRWAWNKPRYVMPPLGKPPSFVTDETAQKIATGVELRRALEAIRNDRSNVAAVVREYLNRIVEGMKIFRISATSSTISTFDDDIVKNIEDFRPYRNELEEVFLSIAAYNPTDEIVDIVHRFFESLMQFYRPLIVANSYYEVDCDNFKFIVYELFLLFLGALIKYDRFHQMSNFMDSEYYFQDITSSNSMHNFSFFREYLSSFESRNKRIKANRISLVADMIHERASASGIEFKYIMTADFSLYFRSNIDSENSWHDKWYPETLVYLPRHAGGLESFARAKSARHFEKVKLMLGVESKEELVDIVTRLSAGAPRYNYERLNIARVLQLDAIATKP